MSISPRSTPVKTQKPTAKRAPPKVAAAKMAATLAAQPRAEPSGTVRVLAGDFNATLDHAPMRRLLSSGYRDAAATVGVGLVGTWGPYDGDLIPPVTIDHVLVDRRVAVAAVSVHPLPGGDHRAVLAELVFRTSHP